MSYYIHSIDPIALSFGDFKLPWYWLVYILGFYFVYGASRFLCREQKLDFTKNDIIDYLLWSWVGMILGARVFYILAYNFQYFLDNPEESIRIWNGGMSFHGGMIGGVIALFAVSRFKGQQLLRITDLIATSIPLVLGFGRIANFINGELAGRPTNVPWAVIFPRYQDHIPRHPSQLYQAALEGFLLFAILYLSRSRLKQAGFQSALFLLGYGLLRLAAEFFRNPDPQIGFLFGGMTMGQLLCLGMIALGVVILRKFTLRKS